MEDNIEDSSNCGNLLPLWSSLDAQFSCFALGIQVVSCGYWLA